ncbi:MAG: endonuclease NucS [Bradyrhizobium sp.]|uniref:endonuclease NucS domain-containing protein n=1 Tax=Bradyrhizobium sp. TaxID=376 RepID=UPI0029BDEA52|nr:endonuclease NucS domain-containing protein [Bradyrhizobium sp.]MDX3970145.1 endonuclease NucS [Bradyrhizobium sp.]
MPIYDRPTKTIMAEWAKAHLKPNQVFSKADVLPWFAQHYPKIKPNTVGMHVEGMSINNPIRKHHPAIKPGSAHDLFFKLGPDKYRLWDPQSDGQPLYKIDMETAEPLGTATEELEAQSEDGGSEFAYEQDLQNYLAKNLHRIEPGLRLHEEEDVTGLEYPAGGRYIDILAVDAQGGFVVIELKVSRGYDRVVGQLLRYMAWVERNLESARPVRGIIVAKEITDDLKLAASRIDGVRLIEYQIEFKLKPVEG